jgi:branched-chain amino acid transport system permease protein
LAVLARSPHIRAGGCRSGLAGGFYAHCISYVGPEVFGFSFMIAMIIMVLAGGVRW